MSDQAFLSEFITEPLYLIKEEKPIVNNYKDVKEEPTSTIAEEPIPIITEKPKAKVELKPIFTSGENLKGCIILVDWKNGEVSSEKELLLKILSSVKRTESDVLIAHAYESSTEQIEALLAEQNHKQVLDFGTDSIPENTSTKLYEIKANGPKKYLKADPISAIATDVEMKKALWKALQEIF